MKCTQDRRDNCSSPAGRVDASKRSGTQDLRPWLTGVRCPTLRLRLVVSGDAGHRKGCCTMAGKSEQIKGKVKEAAGSLVGNKDLESQGSADRRAGESKEKLGHVKDKVEESIEKVEHKVAEVIEKAK